MQGTQEMQAQPLGWADPLEEEMATHSSILAWRIPLTVEPGGLASMHGIFKGGIIRSVGTIRKDLMEETEEGNGNPLQYSCLENFTDRGAWRATVHGVSKSQTQLSD